MKKIFTPILLIAVYFISVTSCSKDVKAPNKLSVINAATSGKPTTPAQTQTTTQTQGHTCGGGSYYNSGDGH